MSEFTLRQVYCQFGTVKAFEQLLYSYQMSLPCAAVDDDDVNVCVTPLDATNDLVDSTLESNWIAFIPKGITLYWKSPWGMMKAETSLVRSVKTTCQNPLSRSNFHNNFALPTLSKQSSILGIVKESVLVQLSIVLTHVIASICLGHQDTWRTTVTVILSYKVIVQ